MAKKQAQTQKQTAKKIDVDQLIENGGLVVRSVLQMVGKPKEHIEASLAEFVKNVESLDQSGFTITKKQFAPAEKQEGSESLFSTFCELDVACDDTTGLLNFCMEAMPSSVEVIEPESMELQAHTLTMMMTDFVGRIHQVDMVAKETRQTNKILAQNLSIMIQNATTILLHTGPKDEKQIAKSLGIPEDQIKHFLKKLVEEKRIEEKDGKFILVSPA